MNIIKGIIKAFKRKDRDYIEVVGFDFDYVKERAVSMISLFDYEVKKPMHQYLLFQWRVILKPKQKDKEKNKDNNIFNEILEFRKESLLKGCKVTNVVMLLSKEKSIKLARYLNDKKFYLLSDLCPATAIELAEKGNYLMLHALVKGFCLFGVDLHPDWQEYKNNQMYY